jgi:hypothetical protein
MDKNNRADRAAGRAANQAADDTGARTPRIVADEVTTTLHAPVLVPALANVSGRLRVDVNGKAVGAIVVDRGQVSVTAPEGEAAVVLNLEDPADFLRIVRGQLNPVVAAIQGRLWLDGDLELAVQVINALAAARPFGANPQKPPQQKDS